MPPFGLIKRNELIRALKKAGFDGPYVGGKHQSMKRNGVTLFIPNPHQDDIGRELLGRVLRQAGITREEWQNL